MSWSRAKVQRIRWPKCNIYTGQSATYTLAKVQRILLVLDSVITFAIIKQINLITYLCWMFIDWYCKARKGGRHCIVAMIQVAFKENLTLGTLS